MKRGMALESLRDGFAERSVGGLGPVRVLLAHDPSTRTCDALCEALRAAFGEVDICDAPSVAYARTVGHVQRFDVNLVCLDLPPAPVGGVRLAQDLARAGRPVVLVTRSLRWLPTSATEVRDLPWLTPEADSAAVARSVAAARERCANLARLPQLAEA